MFDQIMDSYRKSSEAWQQMQQGLLAQFTSPGQSGVNPTPEANRAFQKRWAELAVEVLNKQRQSMEWLYKSGTNIIEQTFLSSEPKSPEDYRRVVDDLWRNLYEEFTAQSEGQFRDIQKWAERAMEMGSSPPR